MQPMKIQRILYFAPAVVTQLLLLPPAQAGPNIMAIGNYRAVPYKRAEGRESFSGKEVIFAFDDPDFDFGRVVVRSNQPASVVRRDYFVGYSGNDLRVSNRAGGQGSPSVSVQEVEIWLKIKGALRPNTKYAWEIEASATREGTAQGGIPAIIPAFWADGQPVGVDVTITEPEDTDSDRIRRMQYPHGMVKTPSFEAQTGAAWVVLRPRNFGDAFGVARFSFREADVTEASDVKSTMPVPVRYIPIRNQAEDQIAEVLSRSSEVVRNTQNAQGFWSSGGDLQANVQLTAQLALALGEINARDEKLTAALNWLAAQKPPDRGSFGVPTVASRLEAVARFGDTGQFAPVIQADTQFLVEAQLEDGGWGPRSPKVQTQDTSVILSDHDHSFAVLKALLEARYAGAEVDPKVFRNTLKYWTEAQGIDGGFTSRLSRYGSVAFPTVAYTATGATGLIISLDMASGFGARRCSTYLGSKDQLKGIDAAIRWLDGSYKDDFRVEGSFVANLDPYVEPDRLFAMGQLSGISQLNGKNHFIESASTLLAHYDEATQMFGVRAPGGGGLGGGESRFAENPSLRRTGWALRVLSAGNAPTVIQRIVAGDDEKGWAQARGDAAHLARFLGRSKGRPYNWRRSDIAYDVARLVDVPLLLLSVVGEPKWTDDQWKKLREYCLAGGSVVVDIGDDSADQREPVLKRLQQTFPEYKLKELSGAAGVFEVTKDRPPISGVLALSNGFRDFLFVPPQSWSCAWHMYDIKGSQQSFYFMEDLLHYATDGTPPRSSFARSTYATPAASSRSLKAAQIQVGSDTIAYPNLIETISRLMQSNYRTRLDEVDAADANLVWVTVAGPAAINETARAKIRGAIKSGRFVFADVVSGNPEWDKTFRSALAGIEPGLTLENLRRNDPVFTGEIAGTQGFDVTNVAFRKALHDRFAQSGRCDLYGLYLGGKQVGVYSSHDISSGIGYHYYPGCRGIEPEGARQIAMNIVLSVYARMIGAESRADAN